MEVSMTGTTRHAKTAAASGKGKAARKISVGARAKVESISPYLHAPTASRPYEPHLKLGDIAARKGIPQGAVVRGFNTLKGFLAYLHSPAAEAIDKVRTGFRVSLVGEYAKRIGMPKEDMFVLINLSRTTAHRMEREDKVMDRLRSDAFAGAARVIEKARDMLGSDEAARNWLSTPVPALDFKTPQEWLDTSDGRQIVSGLLDRIQSGAYA
jgi:putative toxin-antitoxin system antitoxin component (TIGR02293 family)